MRTYTNKHGRKFTSDSEFTSLCEEGFYARHIFNTGSNLAFLGALYESFYILIFIFKSIKPRLGKVKLLMQITLKK